MKQTTNLLFALLTFSLMATFFTSCKKEQVNDNTPDGVAFTFKAGTETNTKTSIDGLTFSWAAGDNLAIATPTSIGTGAAEFNIAFDQEGSRSADFEGTLSVNAGGEIAYAVYPYDNNVLSLSGTSMIATFEHQEEQVQKHKADGSIDPTSIGAYTYMFGKTAAPITSAITESSIAMKHATAIIDLNLDLTGLLESGEKITRVSIRSTKDFERQAEVTLDTEAITNPSDTPRKEISVDIKDHAGNAGVVPTGDNFTARVALLPQELASTSFWTVLVETDKKQYVHGKKFSGAVTIAAGKRYTVAINDLLPASLVLTGGNGVDAENFVQEFVEGGATFEYLEFNWSESRGYQFTKDNADSYLRNVTAMNGLSKIVVMDDGTMNHTLHVGATADAITTPIEVAQVGCYITYTIPSGNKFFKFKPITGNDKTAYAQGFMFTFESLAEPEPEPTKFDYDDFLGAIGETEVDNYSIKDYPADFTNFTFTATATEGTQFRLWGNDKTIRSYDGNIVTITAKSGKKVKKVEFSHSNITHVGGVAETSPGKVWQNGTGVDALTLTLDSAFNTWIEIIVE